MHRGRDIDHGPVSVNHVSSRVEITRNLDYFTEEYLAIFNAAIMGSGELERYQTDWLETRNQIEAARNLLIRAGIPLTPPPGWKSDSNRFRFESNGRKDG